MKEGKSHIVNFQATKLETAIRGDHNPLFTKFWQELVAGKGKEKGDKDVEELVIAYTDTEPLSPMSDDELFKIRAYLRHLFAHAIAEYNKNYISLINDEILLVDTSGTELDVFGSSGAKKHTLLNINNLSRNPRYSKAIEDFKAKGKILTPGDKIKLFSDPEFLQESQYYNIDTEGSSSAFRYRLGAGSRRLTQQVLGGYYESNEQFLSEIESLRERTGRSVPRVLDVGSNFGFALKGMKDLDANIETFNMTIAEHPSLFGDHIVRHPAEMMPAEFEETMDLIDSQGAFQYFLYSDIALRNVIKALSVGGVCRISYLVGRIINASPSMPNLIKEEELENRQAALWASIKTLVDQGYLDMEGSSPWIKESLSMPYKGMQEGFIRLKKNKSTKGMQF